MAWIRPELREKAFRIWEEQIREAVYLYPSPLIFEPRNGMQVSTLLSRLRDARLSLYRFHWKPTKVDMEKFLRIYTDFNITIEDDNKIRMGPRPITSKIQNPTTTLPPGEMIVLTQLAKEPNKIETILHNCASLVHLGVIPSARLKGCDGQTVEQHKETITNSYDVAFCFDRGDVIIL